MSRGFYSDAAKQGTQAPSPAPRLIPAETENQPRTNIAIGTANGGTSKWRFLQQVVRAPASRLSWSLFSGTRLLVVQNRQMLVFLRISSNCLFQESILPL